MVLAIPALVFLYALVYVLYAVAFVGGIIALVLGRYPRGLRDLSAYVIRFQAQTWAYLLLVTDRYPSLSQSPAGSSSQVAPSAPAIESGTSSTPTSV